MIQILLKFVWMGPMNKSSEWPYSDDGEAMNRWQVIIWTNGGLVHWLVYASLSPRKSKRIFFSVTSLTPGQSLTQEGRGGGFGVG